MYLNEFYMSTSEILLIFPSCQSTPSFLSLDLHIFRNNWTVGQDIYRVLSL